ARSSSVLPFSSSQVWPSSPRIFAIRSAVVIFHSPFSAWPLFRAHALEHRRGREAPPLVPAFTGLGLAVVNPPPPLQSSFSETPSQALALLHSPKVVRLGGH